MNTFKLEQLVKGEGEIITSETNLSICLRAGGFIFSLIDKNYCLKAVGDFSVDVDSNIPQIMMNVKTCFSSIGIHIFNFNSIRVVCPTQRTTWVPYKLYDPNQNKQYLKTVAPIYSSDTIIANVVKEIDAVNIFAYPLHKYSGIKIIMPKAQYVSPSQVLVKYAFELCSFMQNTFIMYKTNQSVYFAIFKGNQFTLSNYFEYNTPNDLIFFILSTLQELQINTAEVNLMLTGDAYSEEELHLLKRYIKHVVYANCTENVKVPLEFDGVDLQRHFLTLA